MPIEKLVRVLIILTIFVNCSKKPAGEASEVTDKKFNVFKIKVDRTGLSESEAIMKTKYGKVVIKFYPQKAPNTVARVIQLIQDGFYDNLTFHRVVDNFIVQTGDPTASGTGGSGMKLKAEFNDISHVKGTVAMARSLDDENSADSQFYISLSAAPHLDGKYTVFAQVVDGLDVVSKIVKGDKIISIDYID